MKGKRIFLVLFLIVTFFSAFTGLIKINIINTKALSPLGTATRNYEIVSEEFGEDFSNFINDKSYIKIYDDDSTETMVKIGDNDYIINDESKVVSYSKYLIGELKNGLENIMQWFNDMV